MKKFKVVTSAGHAVIVEAEKVLWVAERPGAAEFLNAQGERVGAFVNIQHWVALIEPASGDVHDA